MLDLPRATLRVKSTSNSTRCVRRIGTRCLGTIVPVPKPPDFSLENEPILSYKKGSPERAELKKALDKMACEYEEVPIVIGNEELKSELCRYQVMVRVGLSRRIDSRDDASVSFRSLTTTRRKWPSITGRRRI